MPLFPDAVIDRPQKADNPRDEAARICVESLQSIGEPDGISGVHIMICKREVDVAEIIDR